MSAWVNNLTDWYTQNKREMPWRLETPNPYYTWVSEIMLQQTQVDTVIPYFHRFTEAFPNIETLAEADEERVLKLWEGLGYYSRARNLHKAAKKVVYEHKGKLPSTFKELQTLPGIGPYCAAAIASIAFGEKVPVVDGNVMRVFCRFWGINTDLRKPEVRNELFERLSAPIKTTNPSNFNQAMMELGALVCKNSKPDCQTCPLSEGCYAYNHHLTNKLPYKSKAAKVPHYTIAVGIIKKDDKILIAKRKPNQLLGGLWELPGGKQKDGESLEETVKREILEETDINVKINNKLGAIKHAYTHFKITMHAYNCTYVSGTPQPKSSDELRWCSWDEMKKLPFPKANNKLFELVK